MLRTLDVMTWPRAIVLQTQWEWCFLKSILRSNYFWSETSFSVTSRNHKILWKELKQYWDNTGLFIFDYGFPSRAQEDQDSLRMHPPSMSPVEKHFRNVLFAKGEGNRGEYYFWILSHALLRFLWHFGSLAISENFFFFFSKIQQSSLMWLNWHSF